MKKVSKSAYSRSTLQWLRRAAMQISGAKRVAHLHPRAYCVAKPAPGVAVFAIPWMDSEPQIREEAYSSSGLVYKGIANVRVGDWCALAYVVTSGGGETYAFQLP